MGHLWSIVVNCGKPEFNQINRGQLASTSLNWVSAGSIGVIWLNQFTSNPPTGVNFNDFFSSSFLYCKDCFIIQLVFVFSGKMYTTNKIPTCSNMWPNSLVTSCDLCQLSPVHLTANMNSFSFLLPNLD